MSDAKLYTIEELRKMSDKDRNKLAMESDKEKAHLIQNIRSGKEKRNHLKGLWEKQIAQIKTLNSESNEN